MHTTRTRHAGGCRPTTTRHRHTLAGGQTGAVAAELVVATPLLLLLVLLFAGFLVFIGYPAIARILAGL